jgi:hypothetical protein
MKVRVQSGGTVSLTQTNFLASGGEGNIHVIGGVTYKVYTDTSKMIPTGKFAELAAIQEPHVIKPEDILFDAHDVPVGFTSRYVPNAGALCQIFTRAFRDRNGLTPADVAGLVSVLRELVSQVHRARVLIVDLNEMNFLLGAQLKDLYAIDVASYQTPHYPATALMESVRDRHAPPGKFSELTDWFAFAILSFQMFTGIHPYKGTHPKVKGLDARMQQNLSVLHKDVRVPPTCYDLDGIPKPYRAWYESLFERGDRVPPPDGKIHVGVIGIPTAHLRVSGTLRITKIEELDANIVGVWEHNGVSVVVTERYAYQADARHVRTRIPGLYDDDGGKGTQGVGFTRTGRPVLATKLSNQVVRLVDLAVYLPLLFGSLPPVAVMSSGGALYAHTKTAVHRLDFVESPTATELTYGRVVAANVLEHATRLFEGGALQNLLGSTYVSLFPTPGTCYQLRLQELDGSKIIDAKFERSVLMVLRARHGTYARLVFRFDDTYATYDVRQVPDVTPNGLNFVVLDTGVCVCLNEEAQLEVFSARKGSSGLRLVEDKALHGAMRLWRYKGAVAFSVGKELYSLALG